MTVDRTDGRRRVIIEALRRLWTAGAFPQSAPWGDEVRVEADIFHRWHDIPSASLLAHREGSENWTEIPCVPGERPVDGGVSRA